MQSLPGAGIPYRLAFLVTQRNCIGTFHQCSEVMSGLTRALKVIKFDAGNQFNVLSVSFNPNETPELAAASKAQYMARYGRPGTTDGWHFLTGPQESITALTQAVGFQYQYDPKTDQ